MNNLMRSKTAYSDGPRDLSKAISYMTKMPMNMGSKVVVTRTGRDKGQGAPNSSYTI